MKMSLLIIVFSACASCSFPTNQSVSLSSITSDRNEVRVRLFVDNELEKLISKDDFFFSAIISIEGGNISDGYQILPEFSVSDGGGGAVDVVFRCPLIATSTIHRAITALEVASVGEAKIIVRWFPKMYIGRRGETFVELGQSFSCSGVGGTTSRMAAD